MSPVLLHRLMVSATRFGRLDEATLAAAERIRDAEKRYFEEALADADAIAIFDAVSS